MNSYLDHKKFTSENYPLPNTPEKCKGCNYRVSLSEDGNVRGCVALWDGACKGSEQRNE